MKSLLPLAAVLVLTAGHAAAATTLSASKAWSRPAVAGTNGVGYVTIANSGKAADAVVKVESPLAARVEMHSSSMSGGVMSMAKVDRVAVPAGGQAVFGPGGYHLMLIGLTRTLKVGDKVPGALTFASGATLKVTFDVSVAPPADGMAAMPGMPH